MLRPTSHRRAGQILAAHVVICWKNLLKAQVEAIAVRLAPKNKSTVIKTFMRRLRVDAATAEEGYADFHRAIDRKPYTSPEGLRNVQRRWR